MLFVIIYIILYCINNSLSYEHMTMKDYYLKKTLNNNGIELDIDNLTIKKCDSSNNCISKKYETKHFNSMYAYDFAKNKNISNKIYMENNIPVPKHYIINNNNKENFISNPNIQFPVVLKPIDGMQGKDVNTFIKNNKQFNTILNDLLTRYNEVMYEEQVYGDNYRIFVFNNKVMDVIKREQPFIIGNGKNTIEELINIKNNEQKKNNLYPTTNISWDYIEENGYTPKSILENDKKLAITNTINFHNGANPIRIKLDNIPNENIDLFIKAHKLGKLECSGIDYMSPDINIPYYINDGHIIEINSMVDTKIHIDADNQANPMFLYEKIAQNAF